MRRAGALVMMALVAASGYLFWRQATIEIARTAIAPSPAEGPRDVTAAPSDVAPQATLPPRDELYETLARPLFTASRRPPEPDPPRQDQPDDESSIAAGPDELHLVGMMRDGKTRNRALIRASGQPIAVWVDEGQDVEGWTLQSVERDRVVVRRNAQTAELRLFPVRAVSARDEADE